MNTRKRILNIAFVSAFLAVNFSLSVSPAFAQPGEKQIEQQVKIPFAADSIETWVNKGIDKVNSGNIDQAIDCFARASKLVPDKH